MKLRTRRDRLTRCYWGKRNAENGSQEDTGSSRLVSTHHCHRSTPISRLYRVLSVLYPKLLEGCTTPLRSYKKDNPVALGRTTIQDLRNVENPHVSKAHTLPA